MAPLAPNLLSDFTGADEDPLDESGRWMGWWPADDELQRLSGAASAHSSGTGYDSSATVDTYPADIHVVAEVAARPAGRSGRAMVVGARITDADTGSHSGYMGAAFTGSPNDNWRIYRVTGGSATLLVSGNDAQLVAGDAIGLVLSGTTIELWHRVSGVWSLRQSTTDGTHTGAGAVGIECAGNIATPGAFASIHTDAGGGISETMGMAVEVSTARTPGKAKSKAFMRASEVDGPLAIHAGRVYAMGRASEGNTARTPGAAKAKSVGRGAETDTARPLSAALIRFLGCVTETDAARSLSPVTAHIIAMVAAVEAGTARLFTAAKARAFTRATETETARPFSKAKARTVGQTAETDTARGVTWALRRLMGRAESAEEATAFRVVVAGETRGTRGAPGASNRPTPGTPGVSTRAATGTPGSSTRVLVGSAGSSTRGTSGSPGTGSDR